MQLSLVLFMATTGASAFFRYDGLESRLINRNVGMQMSKLIQERAPSASISPHFKILDWKIATPIMEEFETMANTLELPSFGWTWEGDNVVFRSSMLDPEKVVSRYFNSFSPLIDKMLESAATMDRLEIRSAPAAGTSGLEGQSEEKPKFNVKHFEMEEGWFTNLNLKDRPIPETMVNVLPRYVIHDEAVAKPILNKIMEMTHDENDCFFFGWTKQGKSLSCQAAFRNGEAMVDHYNKIDPLLSVLFDGPATLEKLEVHGADSELVKTRAVTKKFQNQFKELELKEFSSTKEEVKKLPF